MCFPLVWAVHISDGVLGWPWLAAGFALIGVLALLAAWRIHEEEIPRIALLTAAFFVASSIHVKLGFSSAHLLLNGLVGVILGRRAPLAILLGVTMQALLLAHGGVSTIGVNACTEALPALMAGGLFPVLYVLTRRNHSWTRSLLVGVSAVFLGTCFVFATTLLWSNPLHGMVKWSDRAGLVLTLEPSMPARDVLLHPATLVGLAAIGLTAIVLERRRCTSPEFALGACLGMLSVMATALLTGIVLLADGTNRWNTIVSALLVLHLPLALVEGLILGCTLSFLARVKPEMLGLRMAVLTNESSGEPAPCIRSTTQEPPVPLASRQTRVTLLLVLGVWLLSAGPAHAHRLQAEVQKVDRVNRRVTVESWYETDEIPQEARAQVLRSDGSILAEGALDGRGTFVFAFEKAEPLTVQITAPGGHRATCNIAAEQLEGTSTEADSETSVKRGSRQNGVEGRLQELAAGVALLLAAAAFALSWSNRRRLRRMEDDLAEERR
jgi:cobalt/nickel transport system permease protein